MAMVLRMGVEKVLAKRISLALSSCRHEGRMQTSHRERGRLLGFPRFHDVDLNVRKSGVEMGECTQCRQN